MGDAAALHVREARVGIAAKVQVRIEHAPMGAGSAETGRAAMPGAAAPAANSDCRKRRRFSGFPPSCRI